MAQRTCTIPGCDKPHRAKGYCSGHYKTAFPAPAKTYDSPCDGCGINVPRQRPGRFKYIFCSELCRHWIQWGAWSSKVRPPAHDPKPIPGPRVFGCAWCGIAITTHDGRVRFCSTGCTRRSKRVARRAREANAPGSYTWAEVTRLWITFDKQCAYCHEPTSLADIQAEHVIPLSRGGRNDIGNLLPSCGPCNSDKRDLLLDQWAIDRARRHLAPVITTWTATDTRYMHLVERTHLRISA